MSTRITTIERMSTESQSSPLTLQIGKRGLSKEVLQEIVRQIRKRKMIKIRVLKSALKQESLKSLVSEIISQTNSRAVSQVGNTVVIGNRNHYKRKKLGS